MARIEIIEPRDQEAHFGLYRTSAGGDESIFVRRKVGDPTDYMHTKSRKLKRQRDNLALASKHYAQLSPSQKAITRHQFEEVEFIQSHGKTDTKLLSGRQLFIAKEIRSLNATGKQLILAHELCIMLVGPGLSPLTGELWLRYYENGGWKEADKDQISPGYWLFSQVPKGKEFYRVFGEVSGFFDPQEEAYQFMSEDEIRAYHYHILYPAVEPIIRSQNQPIAYFASNFRAPYATTALYLDYSICHGVVEGQGNVVLKDSAYQPIEKQYYSVHSTGFYPIRHTFYFKDFYFGPTWWIRPSLNQPLPFPALGECILYAYCLP